MNPLDCECNCHQLDHADNCSCYCMMGGMSYRKMEEQLSSLEKTTGYVKEEVIRGAINDINYLIRRSMRLKERLKKLENDVPVITGDSDTDELLEIERCNQEREDKNE